MSDQARMQASEKWLQKYRATNRAVTIASAQPDTPSPQVDIPPPQIEPPSRDDLGLAAQAHYNNISACQNSDQLHAMAKLLWERHGAGLLNDDEANYLTSCIERRKPVSQRTKGGKFAIIAKAGRISRFVPRQRPRSPDRKASRDRRRMLGGSSALPDNLRHHYTEGQRAVLCIVAGEIKRHGVCDLPIDKIAALAGVCRTTVQTAMHEARRLGHIEITERPVPGRKSLPNLVDVVSREWLAWIKRGPSAARDIGSNPVKMVSTTKSIDLSKKRLSNGRASVDHQPWIGSVSKGSG
ncbi:hypothetical protein [Bradyrhizobium sp. AUGA SZCCT0182]|uniref:hypothetical protein n=1 Tax=Bradyrhizobium sp. AUGA SZCCT0182 TaxID=2807667 RepID=UPI001BADA7CC|nr:hypothetical protein [Bradyrhizobium sp. AUGA SZCCT0182]MBR1236976.1 hypothetical protein [Bradyrhizobium sp. AUGA SZCCT0182]